VLLSIGHAMALGIVVPIPYYVQEWLQVSRWKKSDYAGKALLKIFHTIEVSERDQAFFEDVMSSEDDWLTSVKGAIHDYTELRKIFERKLNQVCQLVSLSRLECLRPYPSWLMTV
jgi:hypothetical protein